MVHRFPFRAMASPCELQLFGADPLAVEAAARAAIREVERIEKKYSRYLETSVASAINRSAGSPRGFSADPETVALLDYAAIAWDQSGGLFDVTSGVLREVWDFRSGKLPADADVAAVLERVGWQHVDWKPPVLRMPPGTQIDFGGYGKEYAADRAAEVCHLHGITSGLVDLGGDVRIVGPTPDGESWPVGIRDPRQPWGAVVSLELEAGGIATSGDYQRFMVVDGKRYSHLLDPRSGWPVSGLTSVSVVASRCLVAGTASTIAMLKGEAGASWLDDLGLPNLRVDVRGRVSGSLAAGLGAHAYGDSSSRADETPKREPSIRSTGGVARAVSPGNTTT